ncbi:MAG: lysylphosphatidylglycerol synthase transmembrane domain-containing protein [Candidatus Promineifilaceae bacterium]|nr:lysylphosphatidylglycerol synthase transmembrane domain-containing protein [Candidatus Promineifilaceae bacterium]
MIAEKPKGSTKPQPLTQIRQIPWLRLLLSLALSGLGLWFVTRDASLAEMRAAFGRADVGYVLLGLTIIAVTMMAKAWRWRLLYQPRDEAPSFSDLFWALSLGQLVNTAVPFFRLGEVARVYDLGQQAQSSKAQALGTLVVEKVLDLMMLALTMFLLVPFLVIPQFVTDSGIALAAVAVMAFVGLYLMAYRSDLVLRVSRPVLRRLPGGLGERVEPIATAGLRGLAALRNRRATLALLLTSLLIAGLSVLTPLVLFPALDLSLGLASAAAIHVAVTAGTVPPSTPAKVGVFEFLVAFMLRFFGVENASVILAYTLLFHLVVVSPQILFGGIAAARGRSHA